MSTPNPQSSEVEALIENIVAGVAEYPHGRLALAVDLREQLRATLTRLTIEHPIALDNEYARGWNDGAYEQRVLSEGEHEARMRAMVKAIKDKGVLIENPIAFGEGLTDGSFYQIYKGDIEAITQRYLPNPDTKY